METRGDYIIINIINAIITIDNLPIYIINKLVLCSFVFVWW